ncbi:hypothetical protein JCM3770_005116 [Rhodotorula araucariae]
MPNAPDNTSSPPPAFGPVPGYDDVGAFVYTIEYQLFFIEARKMYSDLQPGLKNKTLRKRVEKLWLETYSVDVKETDVRDCRVGPADAPAASTSKKPAKPKVQHPAATATAPIKPSTSSAKQHWQAQREDTSEDERGDEGAPLGAHRIWDAVEEYD